MATNPNSATGNKSAIGRIFEFEGTNPNDTLFESFFTPSQYSDQLGDYDKTLFKQVEIIGKNEAGEEISSTTEFYNAFTNEFLSGSTVVKPEKIKIEDEFYDISQLRDRQKFNDLQGSFASATAHNDEFGQKANNFLNNDFVTFLDKRSREDIAKQLGTLDNELYRNDDGSIANKFDIQITPFSSQDAVRFSNTIKQIDGYAPSFTAKIKSLATGEEGQSEIKTEQVEYFRDDKGNFYRQNESGDPKLKSFDADILTLTPDSKGNISYDEEVAEIDIASFENDEAVLGFLQNELGGGGDTFAKDSYDRKMYTDSGIYNKLDDGERNWYSLGVFRGIDKIREGNGNLYTNDEGGLTPYGLAGEYLVKPTGNIFENTVGRAFAFAENVVRRPIQVLSAGVDVIGGTIGNTIAIGILDAQGNDYADVVRDKRKDRVEAFDDVIRESFEIQSNAEMKRDIHNLPIMEGYSYEVDGEVFDTSDISIGIGSIFLAGNAAGATGKGAALLSKSSSLGKLGTTGTQVSRAAAGVSKGAQFVQKSSVLNNVAAASILGLTENYKAGDSLDDTQKTLNVASTIAFGLLAGKAEDAIHGGVKLISSPVIGKKALSVIKSPFNFGVNEALSVQSGKSASKLIAASVISKANNGILQKSLKGSANIGYRGVLDMLSDTIVSVTLDSTRASFNNQLLGNGFVPDQNKSYLEGALDIAKRNLTDPTNWAFSAVIGVTGDAQLFNYDIPTSIHTGVKKSGNSVDGRYSPEMLRKAFANSFVDNKTLEKINSSILRLKSSEDVSIRQLDIRQEGIIDSERLVISKLLAINDGTDEGKIVSVEFNKTGSNSKPQLFGLKKAANSEVELLNLGKMVQNLSVNNLVRSVDSIAGIIDKAESAVKKGSKKKIAELAQQLITLSPIHKLLFDSLDGLTNEERYVKVLESALSLSDTIQKTNIKSNQNELGNVIKSSPTLLLLNVNQKLQDAGLNNLANNFELKRFRSMPDQIKSEMVIDSFLNGDKRGALLYQETIFNSIVDKSSKEGTVSNIVSQLDTEIDRLIEMTELGSKTDLEYKESIVNNIESSVSSLESKDDVSVQDIDDIEQSISAAENLILNTDRIESDIKARELVNVSRALIPYISDGDINTENISIRVIGGKVIAEKTKDIAGVKEDSNIDEYASKIGSSKDDIIDVAILTQSIQSIILNKFNYDQTTARTKSEPQNRRSQDQGEKPAQPDERNTSGPKQVQEVDAKQRKDNTKQKKITKKQLLLDRNELIDAEIGKIKDLESEILTALEVSDSLDRIEFSQFEDIDRLSESVDKIMKDFFSDDVTSIMNDPEAKSIIKGFQKWENLNRGRSVFDLDLTKYAIHNGSLTKKTKIIGANIDMITDIVPDYMKSDDWNFEDVAFDLYAKYKTFKADKSELEASIIDYLYTFDAQFKKDWDKILSQAQELEKRNININYEEDFRKPKEFRTPTTWEAETTKTKVAPRSNQKKPQFLPEEIKAPDFDVLKDTNTAISDIIDKAGSFKYQNAKDYQKNITNLSKSINQNFIDTVNKGEGFTLSSLSNNKTADLQSIKSEAISQFDDITRSIVDRASDKYNDELEKIMNETDSLSTVSPARFEKILDSGIEFKQKMQEYYLAASNVLNQKIQSADLDSNIKLTNTEINNYIKDQSTKYEQIKQSQEDQFIQRIQQEPQNAVSRKVPKGSPQKQIRKIIDSYKEDGSAAVTQNLIEYFFPGSDVYDVLTSKAIYQIDRNLSSIEILDQDQIKSIYGDSFEEVDNLDAFYDPVNKTIVLSNTVGDIKEKGMIFMHELAHAIYADNPNMSGLVQSKFTKTESGKWKITDAVRSTFRIQGSVDEYNVKATVLGIIESSRNEFIENGGTSKISNQEFESLAMKALDGSDSDIDNLLNALSPSETKVVAEETMAYHMSNIAVDNAASARDKNRTFLSYLRMADDIDGSKYVQTGNTDSLVRYIRSKVSAIDSESDRNKKNAFDLSQDVQTARVDFDSSKTNEAYKQDNIPDEIKSFEEAIISDNNRADTNEGISQFTIDRLTAFYDLNKRAKQGAKKKYTDSMLKGLGLLGATIGTNLITGPFGLIAGSLTGSYALYKTVLKTNKSAIQDIEKVKQSLTGNESIQGASDLIYATTNNKMQHYANLTEVAKDLYDDLFDKVGPLTGRSKAIKDFLSVADIPKSDRVDALMYILSDVIPTDKDGKPFEVTNKNGEVNESLRTKSYTMPKTNLIDFAREFSIDINRTGDYVAKDTASLENDFLELSAKAKQYVSFETADGRMFGNIVIQFVDNKPQVKFEVDKSKYTGDESLIVPISEFIETGARDAINNSASKEDIEAFNNLVQPVKDINGDYYSINVEHQKYAFKDKSLSRYKFDRQDVIDLYNKLNAENPKIIESFRTLINNYDLQGQELKTLDLIYRSNDRFVPLNTRVKELDKSVRERVLNLDTNENSNRNNIKVGTDYYEDMDLFDSRNTFAIKRDTTFETASMLGDTLQFDSRIAMESDRLRNTNRLKVREHIKTGVSQGFIIDKQLLDISIKQLQKDIESGNKTEIRKLELSKLQRIKDQNKSAINIDGKIYLTNPIEHLYLNLHGVTRTAPRGMESLSNVGLSLAMYSNLIQITENIKLGYAQFMQKSVFSRTVDRLGAQRAKSVLNSIRGLAIDQLYGVITEITKFGLQSSVDIATLSNPLTRYNIAIKTIANNFGIEKFTSTGELQPSYLANIQNKFGINTSVKNIGRVGKIEFTSNSLERGIVDTLGASNTYKVNLFGSKANLFEIEATKGEVIFSPLTAIRKTANDLINTSKAISAETAFQQYLSKDLKMSKQEINKLNVNDPRYLEALRVGEEALSFLKNPGDPYDSPLLSNVFKGLGVPVTAIGWVFGGNSFGLSLLFGRFLMEQNILTGRLVDAVTKTGKKAITNKKITSQDQKNMIGSVIMLGIMGAAAGMASGQEDERTDEYYEEIQRDGVNVFNNEFGESFSLDVYQFLLPNILEDQKRRSVIQALFGDKKEIPTALRTDNAQDGVLDRIRRAQEVYFKEFSSFGDREILADLVTQLVDLFMPTTREIGRVIDASSQTLEQKRPRDAVPKVLTQMFGVTMANAIMGGAATEDKAYSVSDAEAKIRHKMRYDELLDNGKIDQEKYDELVTNLNIDQDTVGTVVQSREAASSFLNLLGFGRKENLLIEQERIDKNRASFAKSLNKIESDFAEGDITEKEYEEKKARIEDRMYKTNIDVESIRSKADQLLREKEIQSLSKGKSSKSSSLNGREYKGRKTKSGKFKIRSTKIRAPKTSKTSTSSTSRFTKATARSRSVKAPTIKTVKIGSPNKIPKIKNFKLKAS